MVEKDSAALNFEIRKQITKFDVKMRNFEKNSELFYAAKNNM